MAASPGLSLMKNIIWLKQLHSFFAGPKLLLQSDSIPLEEKQFLRLKSIKGSNRPYQVKDEDGKWLSYFRHGDQNLVANRVLLQVWRKEEKGSGVLVKFGKMLKIP